MRSREPELPVSRDKCRACWCIGCRGTFGAVFLLSVFLVWPVIDSLIRGHEDLAARVAFLEMLERKR
jgi:hypothetical protein